MFQNILFKFNPLSDFRVRQHAGCDRPHIEPRWILKIAGFWGVFFPILSPKMFKRLESCSALTQICAVRVCWRVNRGGHHVNQYWLKRERTSILHSTSLQSVQTAAAPVCASHVSYAEISAFYSEDKYLVVFKNPEGCLITLWEGIYRVPKRLLPSGRKIFHPQWDKKNLFHQFPRK